MTKTIRECLETIGDITLDDNMTLDEEFKVIKKSYFKKVLECHPDKGGDPAIFREVQTSFEVLREMMTKNLVSSFHLEMNGVANDYDETMNDFTNMNNAGETPSWQYYYDAAEEDVPAYKIELAKSNRSKCAAKTKTARKCAPVDEDSFIKMGTVRIGRLEELSGSYTNWVHLECWRVPSRVWLGLPKVDDDGDGKIDDKAFAEAFAKMELVLLCGFANLPEEDQAKVIEHVKDKSNWAKLIKRKPKKSKNTTESSNATGAASANDDDVVKTVQKSSAVVPVTAISQRQKFVMPIPGKDGALAGSLAGKTVVLTGIFPEVGGGAGLNLGKDKVKQMIESFGGRVTGSVSGKTDILIVGKEPGMSKVSKARDPKNNKKSTIQLLDVHEVSNVCRGQHCLEDSKPAVIGAFSAGYNSNGLALTASAADLEHLRSPPKKSQEEKKDEADGNDGAAPTRKDKRKKPPQPTKSMPKAIKCEEGDDSKKPAAKSTTTTAKRNKRKAAPATKQRAKPAKSSSVPDATTSSDMDVTNENMKPSAVVSSTSLVPMNDQNPSKRPRRSTRNSAVCYTE